MNSRTTRASRAPFTVAAALAAALLVAGCSLSRPSPVKQSYLIEPAAPPAVASPQPASLRVGTVNVAAPFRGRPFVVREGELRYETDFYSEFLVAPAPMLSEATARALGNARVFARVVAPGAPPDADYVLDGFVTALYEDLRSSTAPAADIVVTYYLSRADNTVPFWSKEYRQHVPLTTASPDAYAAALSNGFATIMAELARDLAAVDLAKR
jgi:ABC-type uncharacterized transport system auxiliary subunit